MERHELYYIDLTIKRLESEMIQNPGNDPARINLERAREEKAQLDSIKGINVSGVGFVCTGGFDFENTEGFLLILTGKTYMMTPLTFLMEEASKKVCSSKLVPLTL